jgi:hypothetical protein
MWRLSQSFLSLSPIPEQLLNSYANLIMPGWGSRRLQSCCDCGKNWYDHNEVGTAFGLDAGRDCFGGVCLPYDCPLPERLPYMSHLVILNIAPLNSIEF